MRVLATLVFLALAACAARTPPETAADVPPRTLAAAVAETMDASRRALAELGESEAAMERIQLALATLAVEPALVGYAPTGTLHGAATMKADVLASDGDEALTLIYVRFLAESSTPVHDHLTWGVVRVVEGEDRYTEWERGDDAGAPKVRTKRDVLLRPGDSIHWLPPPGDVHSQAPVGGDAAELVMAGKNLLGNAVLHHRHTYDPESGRLNPAPPH